jgi:uncharacterized SAM-binding protein YcdF (DUF218 family)
LLGGGVTIALVFSSGMVAAALMSPLEYAYPTLRNASAYPQVDRIVVLTAWATEDPAMPLTGRLNASAAYRVLLALELARERPDCEIVVSGDEVTARIMSQVLLKLGVPAERLSTSGGATTDDSVQLLAPLLGGHEFFLVTSGGHMPRSMEAMARVGLHAIPAPTDHQLPRDWRQAEWQPGVFHLSVSDLAVHEYLGRLWYRLRDGAPAQVKPS